MANGIVNDEPTEAGAPAGRKPYVPPSLSKVPLRVEEAVLGFCKSSTAGGPLQGACDSVPACFDSGS